MERTSIYRQRVEIRIVTFLKLMTIARDTHSKGHLRRDTFIEMSHIIFLDEIPGLGAIAALLPE